MTWICGMPECRAVRPGLSEVIVDGSKWVAMVTALREIASCEGPDHLLDINAKNMRDAAREALGITAETDVDPTPEHLLKQGYRSGKSTAPETKDVG